MPASRKTRSGLPGNCWTNRRSICWPADFLSNVGLALTDFALQNKKPVRRGEPLTDALVWEKGTGTCYRLRPSTYMQAAMLVEDAAKLKAKRWVTVAPNYEYGQSAVKWFKRCWRRSSPDVSSSASNGRRLGKIDAGATVAALAQAKPDAILNVTFGPDLTNFVRQGNTRGLFEDRGVVSVLTGEPEYLDPLGDETPAGWIVTGYPGRQRQRLRATPRSSTPTRRGSRSVPEMGSVVGYALITAIAAGIANAGRHGHRENGRRLRRRGIRHAVRASVPGARMDHQSTLGTYVGKTALKDGKGTMVDWHYVDGADRAAVRSTGAGV